MKYFLGWRSGLILLAAVIGLAQTTQPQQSPRTGSTPPPGSTAGPSLPSPTGVGEAVDPNKYSIGAEDVLYVQVWREIDFTKMVAVRPDGKITMPLIGEVQAAGLTPMQLTKDLTEKLGQYVNRPDVTITVEQVRSKKYYIDGGVNRPGEYPLVTPTRIYEALSKAGGFTEFASRKKVKVIRQDGKQVFRFNWNDVSKGKHLEQNIYLENGDHIYVPQ